MLSKNLLIKIFFNKNLEVKLLTLYCKAAKEVSKKNILKNMLSYKFKVKYLKSPPNYISQKLL